MRWDIIIPLAIYLVLLIGIAVWAFNQRQAVQTGGKSAEYYIAGRGLGWFILIFTLLASAASAGTYIGGPGFGYEWGYGWVLAAMAQVPATLLVLGVLGKKFAIVARKLHALTVTDFLRHRYGSHVVVILAAIGIVASLMVYMSAQFVGGARILQEITGVPYIWLVIIFAGIVAFYTSVGGFRADAISDALQGVIMLFGGVVLWIAVLAATGGMTDVAGELKQRHPDLLTLPGAGNFTILLLFSFFVVFGLVPAALPHLTVRAMSYQDTASVHRAIYVGPVIMAIFTLGFIGMGPVARVFYPELAVGDLAVPRMIVDVLPGWVAGALFAAPMAAIMSTVDSMILVVSSAIIRDLYMNYFNPSLPDHSVSRLGSWTSLILGVIVLLISIRPPQLLEYLILFAIGGLASTLFIPLVAGLYWKRANATAAVLGMVGGMGGYVCFRVFVPNLPIDPLPITLVISGVLYLVGAYLGPPPRREALVKFWGTQEEIDRLVGVEATQTGMVRRS
jgi:sodium/pantothenate symporter